MKQKGKFIVIEGLDGSGLSTQAELLQNFFKNNGTKAYLTKEPTNNVIGGLIRGALSEVYKLPPETLQLLFVADRGHHLDHEILPILKEGHVVICDRYFWSTVAFGSLAVDRGWLLELNKYAIIPDMTILLKVPPKICIERISHKRFAFELFEKEKELEKIWRTYLWLSKKFKRRIKIVDGVGEIDQVHKRIVKLVSQSLK